MNYTRGKLRLAKQILGLIVIAAIAIFLPSCGGNDSRTAQKTSVRVGWQVAWATQGQIAQSMMKTNALELANLDGDFKQFLYGAPLSEAALANELDVAFIGDQPAINLISKTPDWKIVARLMDFRVAIVVPPNSDVKEIKDLKGKTVGIPFGASTHRFALQAFRDAGLEPGKDITLLNIDIQEQGETIRAAGGKAWSKVDAFASWDHHIASYEKEGLARILSTGTALGVVAMSNRFISQNPEAAKDFLAAMKLAYFYYAKHQSDTDRWFADAAQGKISPELLAQVAEIEKNLKAGTIGDVMMQLDTGHVKVLQVAADFAFEQKLIQAPLDVSKSVDTELMKQADAKISNDLVDRLTVGK